MKPLSDKGLRAVFDGYNRIKIERKIDIIIEFPKIDFLDKQTKLAQKNAKKMAVERRNKRQPNMNIDSRNGKNIYHKNNKKDTPKNVLYENYI